jgi:hypothetical protein
MLRFAALKHCEIYTVVYSRIVFESYIAAPFAIFSGAARKLSIDTP